MNGQMVRFSVIFFIHEKGGALSRLSYYTSAQNPSNSSLNLIIWSPWIAFIASHEQLILCGIAVGKLTWKLFPVNYCAWPQLRSGTQFSYLALII